VPESINNEEQQTGTPSKCTSRSFLSWKTSRSEIEFHRLQGTTSGLFHSCKSWL